MELEAKYEVPICPYTLLHDFEDLPFVQPYLWWPTRLTMQPGKDSKLWKYSTSVSGLDSCALVAALVANPHQIRSHQLWPRRVQKNSLFWDALSSGVAMNMTGMWQKKMLGHPRPQECWLLLYVYVFCFVCFDVLTCLVKKKWLFRWSVGCFVLRMGRWFLWRLELNGIVIISIMLIHFEA